jgi:hypothetical protein
VDEFWSNVISQAKRDKVKELQVHGIVGKNHEGDFIHAPVLQVEFRNGKVMDELIFGNWGHQ